MIKYLPEDDKFLIITEALNISFNRFDVYQIDKDSFVLSYFMSSSRKLVIYIFKFELGNIRTYSHKLQTSLDNGNYFHILYNFNLIFLSN